MSLQTTVAKLPLGRVKAFLFDRGGRLPVQDEDPPLLSRLHTRWNVAEVTFVFIAVYLLGILYGMVVQDLMYGLSYSLFGDWADQAQFAIATVLENLCLVWGVGFIAHRTGGRWFDVGLGKPKSWLPVLMGVAAGLVLYYLVGLSDYIVSLVAGIRPNDHPVVSMVTEARNWKEMIVPLLLSGLVVPIGEEVFFRGFAYPALRNRIGVWPGIVATGLIFAVLHFDLFGLLALTVAGIALTALYEKSGSLPLVITAHAVWNILVAVGLYLMGVG